MASPPLRALLTRAGLSAPLAVLGALLVGVGVGHFFLPRTTVTGPTLDIVASLPAAEPPRSAGLDVEAPDVVGLDVATVEQVLADTGAEGVRVEVVDRPAAGTPGRVVAQDPPPGRPLDDVLKIGVSTPSLTPDLVGQKLSEAQTALAASGVVVRIERVVSVEPAGLVSQTRPAAGEPLPEVVTLTVTDPGISVSLAAAPSVGRSSCSPAQQSVANGVTLTDNLVCTVTQGAPDPAVAEFTIARAALRLTATAGVVDTGPVAGGVIRVIGDDVLLGEVTVGFGDTVPVDVNVTGVLRLRIEVVALGTGDARPLRPQIVLGEVQLQGDEAALTALVNG